jgi:hypothetical protein
MQIKVTKTASLRDAFCNEVVKLSPSELWNMDLHGSSNLRNFVLSPATSCTKLTNLDLSECKSLAYVLIQSQTLQNIKLHDCGKLNKVGKCSKRHSINVNTLEKTYPLPMYVPPRFCYTAQSSRIFPS